MSPEQKARKLSDIAEDIDEAYWLVEAAVMASEGLAREHGNALATLLSEVSRRLKRASEEITQREAA